MIYIYLISGLFIGWTLGANNIGTIFGAAVTTRMIKFSQAALIASVFYFLGAVFEGSGPSGTLGRLGSVDALGGAFTVALAAALIVLAVVRTGIPISISQSIVGALVAWNFFSGRLTDYHSLITIASSWVVSFLASAAFAALLFHIVRRWVNRSKRHLLEQDMITRWLLVIFGALGSYFLGANTIASAVGVFVPVSPFPDLSLGPFMISGVQFLYILGALSVVLGIYTFSHRVMGTVGKDIFQLSPVTALVALIAETIVLFMFSSQGLQNLLHSLGLPAIPLVTISSTHVIVGAVTGIGLAMGGKNIRYSVLGKVSLAWLAAPVMAFAFAFVALFITQNVFELQIHLPLVYTVDKEAVMEIERRELDSKGLSFVNLRSFKSEMELYKELTLDKTYSRDEAKEIVSICEVYPLQVNMELLYKRGLQRRLKPAQVDALQELEERKYKRRWELAQALAEDASWQGVAQPESPAQEAQNARLEGELDLLYKVFYLPPEPESGK
ncbi:MAG: inorganic phosphate transporter [Candidatus Cloacimonadaceae bacterium]|jgi:PiT family inorganic phosphate transporter|nr:inorganic phosphate transporter family protein [Candidatus Cloacimonadota bacterium]MDX9949381.1 inorganic phosphate transporter [Candidatus Syntrophosphaera sp.]